jgi:hypothetical protein
VAVLAPRSWRGACCTGSACCGAGPDYPSGSPSRFWTVECPAPRPLSPTINLARETSRLVVLAVETALGYFEREQIREQIREQNERDQGLGVAPVFRKRCLTWCFASGPPGARTPLHGLKGTWYPCWSVRGCACWVGQCGNGGWLRAGLSGPVMARLARFGRSFGRRSRKVG